MSEEAVHAIDEAGSRIERHHVEPLHQDAAAAQHVPAITESGVGVISHPDLRWKRCDVKSTNLLANVLANEAAHRKGSYEAVLVGADGSVTEATHSSVLWVRGARIEGTPEGPGSPT